MSTFHADRRWLQGLSLAWRHSRRNIVRRKQSFPPFAGTEKRRCLRKRDARTQL